MSNEVKIGEQFQGEIINIANYGAFVKLKNKREGLIHISKIAKEYVKNVKDYLKKGDLVTVEVVEEKKDGKLDLKLLEKIQNKKEKVKPKKYFDASTSWGSDEHRRRRSEGLRSFDDKMKAFLKESDEKLSDIKKNIEAKRT